MIYMQISATVLVIVFTWCFKFVLSFGVFDLVILRETTITKKKHDKYVFHKLDRIPNY